MKKQKTLEEIRFERVSEIHKQISELLSTIPKEHHKNVKKLGNLFKELGSIHVLNLVSELYNIDPKEPEDFSVSHYSDY